MSYRARLSAKPLADLCHRLALSTESGIDIRRCWQREAEHARGANKKAYQRVYEGVAAGDSLSVSLARTGRQFPRLFLEMTHVGEQTGSLPAVLHRLSEHYQRQFEMARDFRRQLAWPVFQLVAAVVIIGVLLAILAALNATKLNGEPIDVLGLGVTGQDAVVRYIQLVVVALLVACGLLYAIRNGVLSLRPLQHLVMRVPVVGQAIEKICLARLSWALHLTLNVEMDLRRLVPLALRSTGSDYYTSRSQQITDAIVAGSPLHQAFAQTGIFPAHFLDALYVAEESGQIVESMSRLSRQYQQEADLAMATLSTVLGFVIWGGIMVMIAVMVIRLFKVLYVDSITDAMNL
ncbi:Type II secretion system protein F [Posidoniimonas polymericola]|uniref:Type II secretion system protein F n=1 Tax=Posidoniimonas polymericola TaxID=2528002 RepID=A0A5C5YE46_9BACT|nr:type II secretion system F family protein [Posidoniimonas polymericola]TWT73620.1 Type II secretion system protein F [Posidoniimonas polymericola]